MEVVLVDCEDKASNVVSKSGFLFCERFIVTVGSLILPFFKQKERAPISCDATKINEHLRFFVTRSGFVRCEAKISAVFESENVRNCFEEIFGEWSIDLFKNTLVAKKSLALFVILDISGGVCTENDVINELIALKRIIRGLKGEVFKGREVLVESVPFGNKHFINSRSCGIVSNVLGEKYCFILSDCPTVPGSEGSPLYLKKESSNIAKVAPIGIVISSLTWWRGEWIGLTICINLFAFLDEILSLKIAKNPSENSLNTSSPLSEEKFLLQVTCTGKWGTAILLNKNQGILLTNSHVVSKGQRVDLRWGNEVFHGEILYQTPVDSPCDLAFLKTDPKNCRFMENVWFARREAVKGETVFAAGYSLFRPKIRAQPTLSRGIVSQVSPTMVKTTCCINPGASGGALIRPNGELLGIIVSNAKLVEKENASFPRVNMCIAVCAVKGVIERFLEVLDVGILKELDWVDANLWREWIILEGKL